MLFIKKKKKVSRFQLRQFQFLIQIKEIIRQDDLEEKQNTKQRAKELIIMTAKSITQIEMKLWE